MQGHENEEQKDDLFSLLDILRHLVFLRCC